MKLRILKGTRSDNKRLCDTCRWAGILKGAAESEEYIYCRWMDHEVPLCVVECTGYDDKTIPSLGDMRAIAWTLETKDNRVIGFVSPKERRHRKGFGDDDDD